MQNNLKVLSNIPKYIQNSKLYFKECLRIKEKEESEIIPFTTNYAQDKLLSIIELHYKKYPIARSRPTLYIIVLKARQQGISTASEALLFRAITLGMPNSLPNNKIAMVVSYDEESAKVINEMSDRYYQNLPQALKPLKRDSRGKGLLFENPDFNSSMPVSDNNKTGLQSKFLIDTANNKNVGSGMTINYLHISELAKWAQPEEPMTSLMQAVPKRNGIVIIESTAKGMGYFKDMWDKAAAGENDYYALFLPWFEHLEYKEKFSSNKEKLEFEESLDEEEKDLVKTYNVTLEQLKWRRNTIRNKCNGSVDTFFQEYPAYPEQAFLSSGTPVFSQQIVSSRKKQLEEYYKLKPYIRGNFVYEYKNEKIVKSSIKFIEDPNGYVKIYEKPIARYPYVIGGDTAGEGIDKQVGQVLNNTNGKQVATWYGKTDPDLYARQMYCLGHYYNYALISIEMNFDPYAIIELKRLGYRRQYKRTNIDAITEEKQDRYGFNTNKQTRPAIISELVAIVRETPELINDITTLDEMLSFKVNDKGRQEAEKGKHDDCVMALAIAYKAMSQQSRTPFEEYVEPDEVYETGFGRTGY